MSESEYEGKRAARLASRYVKDLESVMEHYGMEDKIYLTESLIRITEIHLKLEVDYLEKVGEVFDDLLKKYRNRLKPFSRASFHTYYEPGLVLVEKGIISSKEFNADQNNQALEEYEFEAFLKMVLKVLNNHRYHYYLESEHPSLEEIDETGGSSEFTISRQLLTLYFLLKTLGVEPRSTVDIAPVARFAHLITGTTFGKLQNSNLYKKLKKVPNFKEDKALIKDLEFIIPFFKELNLENSVDLIEQEIKLAKAKKY